MPYFPLLLSSTFLNLAFKALRNLLWWLLGSGNHLPNKQYLLLSCSQSIRRRICWKRRRALSLSCKPYWPTKCLTSNCGWQPMNSASSQRSGWMVCFGLTLLGQDGNRSGSNPGSSEIRFGLQILAGCFIIFWYSELSQPQSNLSCNDDGRLGSKSQTYCQGEIEQAVT